MLFHSSNRFITSVQLDVTKPQLGHLPTCCIAIGGLLDSSTTTTTATTTTIHVTTYKQVYKGLVAMAFGWMMCGWLVGTSPTSPHHHR
ncbi:unnamed protein product [Brugia pahangi]|uniref:Transmembrane protein n=1 Tax=Brugia pahangi TaxID=6280 RepID=A0A158PRX5_BRUPA|nr:unnamed protein product [Brugia pahangi]